MGSEKMEPKGGEPELQRGEPEHLEPNERFEFLPHDEVIASFGYTRWIYGDLWAAFDQYRSRVSELESRASRAEARVVEIEAERAETEAKLAAVERRNGELVDAIGLALTWLGSAHISQGSNNMHRKVSVAEDILKFARKTPAEIEAATARRNQKETT